MLYSDTICNSPRGESYMVGGDDEAGVEPTDDDDDDETEPQTNDDVEDVDDAEEDGDDSMGEFDDDGAAGVGGDGGSCFGEVTVIGDDTDL